MADSYDVAAVQAFHNQLITLMAEDADGLRETHRFRRVKAKHDHWDRLGGVALTQITNRLQSVVATEHTHTRRRVSFTDWTGAEFVDKFDEIRAMIDPRNEYTQSLLRAARHRRARILTDAIDATVTSVANDDTTSTAALPASQVIANGGTGLTVAKLRQIKRIMDNAGVPASGRTALVSAFGIEDLLADSQVTSADYNTLGALHNGQLPAGQYMGFKFKMISDAIPDEGAVLTGGTADPIILPKSGNIRTCFFYHHDAMGVSETMDVTILVSKRVDLVMEPWQVQVGLSEGAVRILDAGVVTADIDESV